MKRFDLSDAHPRLLWICILSSFTGLKEKLDEYNELMKSVFGKLKAILADRKVLLGVIKEEILVIKKMNTEMTEGTKIGF